MPEEMESGAEVPGSDAANEANEVSAGETSGLSLAALAGVLVIVIAFFVFLGFYIVQN